MTEPAHPVPEQASTPHRIWGLRQADWPLPRPGTMLVRNDHDDAATTDYLHRFATVDDGSRTLGRIVVRPTPGASDRTTLALDLLTALGKNPEVLRQERLGPAAWGYARAWLIGDGVHDLLIDRAHQLSADRHTELAELAAAADCTLWLIWSDVDSAAAAAAALRAHTAHPVVSLKPSRMMAELPAPSRQQPPAKYSPNEGWPVLPTAEFTTFRAACRRLLSPRDFDRVDAVYRAVASRADAWIEDHHSFINQPRASFGPRLAAWLRDEQLGPAETAPSALITLRATQASLLLHGILLCWDPSALGPEPAEQLPNGLPRRGQARALASMARTDTVAATALSWHLNQPPTVFDCWRCGDIAPDGSRITAPEAHRHTLPVYSDHPDYLDAIETSSGITEIACQHTIHVPPAMRPLIAAHRALRQAEHASVEDPFFRSAQQPDQPAAPTMLRHAIHRTSSARLNHVPNWLHRDPCRTGADIGLAPRPHGWLVERHLSVHALDPAVVAYLPEARIRPHPAPGDVC